MSEQFKSAGYAVTDKQRNAVFGIGKTADEAWADLLANMNINDLLEYEGDHWDDNSQLRNDYEIFAATADLIQAVETRGGDIPPPAKRSRSMTRTAPLVLAIAFTLALPASSYARHRYHHHRHHHKPVPVSGCPMPETITLDNVTTKPVESPSPYGVLVRPRINPLELFKPRETP